MSLHGWVSARVLSRADAVYSHAGAMAADSITAPGLYDEGDDPGDDHHVVPSSSDDAGFEGDATSDDSDVDPIDPLGEFSGDLADSIHADSPYWEGLAAPSISSDSREGAWNEQVDRLHGQVLDDDDRIVQRASRLATELGWKDDGARVLADILRDLGLRGSTTTAILRAHRDCDFTPDRLRLAHEIRQLWAGTPQFSTEIRGSRWTNDASYGRGQLAWRTALTLARHPVACDDISVVESFLLAAHEYWYNSHSRREHAFFESYLRSYLESVQDASLWRLTMHHAA